MDSVTQFALGAAVGAAVLGRRVGPRRAVLVGGVLGTLPDLDVFWPFDDVIDSFVLHRSVTHSLVVHAAVTPLLGEFFRLAVRPLRDARGVAWLAVFLCLATHALLDGMTVYGTRLLWPLWDTPLGVGSAFIIDPLYTLPLIVAVAWAVVGNRWTPSFARALTVAFAMSTGYLGWGVAAQQVAESRARVALVAAGMEPGEMLATPTPFNSLFWKVIALDAQPDGAGWYANVYVPLLGGKDAVSVYRHPRGVGVSRCLAGNPLAVTLADFADGFVRLERGDDGFAVADLRMGLTPAYVFRFVVAEHRDGAVVVADPRRVRSPRSAPGDVEWLWAGIRGQRFVRPAESAAVVSPGAAVRHAADLDGAARC